MQATAKNPERSNSINNVRSFMAVCALQNESQKRRSAMGMSRPHS
jgi:hypothetical protein